MAAKRTKATNGVHHRVDLLDHKLPAKRRILNNSGAAPAAQDQFDKVLTEYYAAKGSESDPCSFDALMQDTLRSESLAQRILSMPAITASQVLTKLSIIDSELLADLDNEAPVERRHLVAFAALKVDIVRLLAGQPE